MNFLEKLDMLMEKHGLNKSTLSKHSGIPYTTIDGFYKKGYSNTKLSTVRKLAKCFDVSLDYLIDDTITDVTYGKKVAPTSEKSEVDARLKRIVDIYNSVNEQGKTQLATQAEIIKSSSLFDEHSNVPSEELA